MEVPVMQDILGKNDRIAAENQALFADKKIFVLNLMGSPGSGKTSVLEKTMAALKDELHMAVIEGDLFTTKDADRIAKYDVPVIQINTSGGCHLDAPMVQKVLGQLDLDLLDLLIVENVGNLVCPAEFDTGSSKNAMILSVPEGDDKPLKYPLMFSIVDVLLINKIDVLPYFDFDVDACIERAKKCNPNIKVILCSARNGEGIEEFADWIKTEVATWKKEQ